MKTEQEVRDRLAESDADIANYTAALQQPQSREQHRDEPHRDEQLHNLLYNACTERHMLRWVLEDTRAKAATRAPQEES